LYNNQLIMPPPVKHHTPEARKESHRLSALKYSQTNKQSVMAANTAYYNANKDKVNTRRRERYAEKKAAALA
jgi:hypothetical protein